MRKTVTGLWQPLGVVLAAVLLIVGISTGGHTQAAGLFQTIPTPTPRSIGPTVQNTPPSQPPATPGSGSTPEPGASPIVGAATPELGGTTAGGMLELHKTVSPQDPVPGQELEFSLYATNVSASAVPGILVVDELDPLLQLLEVRGTHGAARVRDQTITVDIGTLDPGESALLIFRVRVRVEAQPGQVIVNQAIAYTAGGEVLSNLVAAGLPPAELPATGERGKVP